MSVITIEKFVKRVVTAGPAASLATVAGLMQEHNVGAVVVLEHDKPIGIVTDRDLTLAFGTRAKTPQTPVRDVMSAPVEWIPLEAGILDTTEALKRSHVRRLAVIDRDDRLVGIVTLDDLLRVLARELSNLIDGISQEMEVK